MASKAATWAKKYREAEQAREAMRCAKPERVYLKLGPGRGIEIAVDEYGQGAKLTTPPAAQSPEPITEKDLIAFAHAILDTFGEPDAKETTRHDHHDR